MDLDFQSFKPLIGALESAGLPVLSTVLAAAFGPAGFVVGPALAILMPIINRQLGLNEDAAPQQAADLITADPAAAKDKLAAVQEDHAYLLQSAKQAQDFQLAAQGQQVAINTAEATNPSWFVAGWRPATCWALVLNLVLIIFVPWIVWLALCVGFRLPDAPATNTELVIGMISALLGLGAMRSYDKSKGTAAARIGGPSPAPVTAKRATR